MAPPALFGLSKTKSIKSWDGNCPVEIVPFQHMDVSNIVPASCSLFNDPVEILRWPTYFIPTWSAPTLQLPLYRERKKRVEKFGTSTAHFSLMLFYTTTRLPSLITFHQWPWPVYQMPNLFTKPNYSHDYNPFKWKVINNLIPLFTWIYFWEFFFQAVIEGKNRSP